MVKLDIAVSHACLPPDRPDLTYFITRPRHPPVLSYETGPPAHRDFFGGEQGKRHIVRCLAQGPEEPYALGEPIARTIYKPVMNSHRRTGEGMAILEPVLSEYMLGTCPMMLSEATDEAVRRGVSEAAAGDFILAHLRAELAIAFQEKEGARFSGGALKAIERAKPVLFQPDWKRVFAPEAIAESVRRITGPSS